MQSGPDAGTECRSPAGSLTCAAQNRDPFLTGGYTPAFHLFGSAASGANIGFGLHYWFLPHLGVRAEFRDIVLPAMSPENVWVFRGGIAFR